MKAANRSVPKRFDDQLEALLTYIGQKGWTLIGIDVQELTTDLANQRAERQAKLDLDRQLASASEAFLRSQAARYARYMRTLEVLRAAHRDDPEVQKALEQFKREAKKPSTLAADPTEDETATP